MKAPVFATLVVLMPSMVSPASALAGWHLMAPPCAPAHTVTLNDGSKTLQPIGCEPVDTGGGIRRLASLSTWKSLGTLDSVEACDSLMTALIKQTGEAYSEAEQRDGILNPTARTLYRTYDQMSYARCIPSNDTRGWHLLVPPRSPYNENASFPQGLKVLTDAPLSKWGEAAVLDSKEVCEIIKTVRLSSQKSIYSGSSEHYIRLLEDQAAAKARGDDKWLSDHGPAIKFQRYITESDRARIRAFEAARCIATDDPRLK
jgi:hypothetical protein